MPKPVIDNLTAAIANLVDGAVRSRTPASFSLFALLRFDEGESVEAVALCGHPRLPEEKGELVRVYFDCDNAAAVADDIGLLLVPEIRKSFVGSGQTELRMTPEGFVIVSANPS